MKNIILILLIGTVLLTANAQKSKITIFTNIEEAKFQAKLNGVVQNNTFGNSTSIENLDTKTYQLRIIFIDTDVKPIDKSVKVNPNMEYTFEIQKKSDAKQKFSKLGKRMARDITLRDRDTSSLQDLYQIKAISINPIRGANINNYSSENTNTENYNKSANINSTNTANGNSYTSTNVNTSSSYSTTTTPTKNSANLNVNTTGINLNVNISDNTETYRETVTTQNTTEHYVMQGYSGPIGCPWPMNENDFYNAKNSIASKSFADSKLAMAKQIANSNCLTSMQVRELLSLFDFEDTKLDFAKYCYGYTYDLGNYYLVNDAFDFESSIDELNNYINTR